MEPSVVVRERKGNIVRLLKPVLRAYALGYLSSTTPRVVSSLRCLRRNDLSRAQKLQDLFRSLTCSIRRDSFPSFCALLVGGSTLSPFLILQLCDLVNRRLGSKGKISKSQGFVRLVRFVTAFISSMLSLRLLNKRPLRLQGASDNAHYDTRSNKNAPTQLESNQGTNEGPREFAGRTMDLTLFTLTRAVDAVACLAWSTWCHRRKSRNRLTKVETALPQLADAGTFAASSAIVMWAWFYVPERLPRSYEKWIGEIAKVDTRLIEALRRARMHVFVYGKDTGQAPLLESMCKDYNWPIEWGNPAKTIPIPCAMVHMDCGPNCEVHAITRFARTFKVACATYIPLQLAFRPRAIKSTELLAHALSDAMRSSAFLASFVTLFYYSVCLARTRLGPKVFDLKTVTPQMWDAGLCVGAGCLTCGWSVLVEHPRKRQELALFVAPRAAATVLPRIYEKKYQRREYAAFAMSAAILFTCLQERPRIIRGVFGKIASGVLS